MAHSPRPPRVGTAERDREIDSANHSIVSVFLKDAFDFQGSHRLNNIHPGDPVLPLAPSLGAGGATGEKAAAMGVIPPFTPDPPWVPT